jgi:protein-S-isoprenylcysteine O-methyltransferase Ste14
LLFLTAFVVRPALLRWRTGRWGIHGISGRVGSPGWWGGVSFVLALAATPAALCVEARPSPDALGPVGAVLALAGLGLTLAAQAGMGASWRIGVAEADRTALVTNGLFGWVRNPVFTGLGLFGAGVLALWPNALSALGSFALVVAVELQVRFVEEPYLVRVHGDAWRAWAARVGRFVPGLGRVR